MRREKKEHEKFVKSHIRWSSDWSTVDILGACQDFTFAFFSLLCPLRGLKGIRAGECETHLWKLISHPLQKFAQTQGMCILFNTFKYKFPDYKWWNVHPSHYKWDWTFDIFNLLTLWVWMISQKKRMFKLTFSLAYRSFMPNTLTNMAKNSFVKERKFDNNLARLAIALEKMVVSKEKKKEDGEQVQVFKNNTHLWEGNKSRSIFGQHSLDSSHFLLSLFSFSSSSLCPFTGYLEKLI